MGATSRDTSTGGTETKDYEHTEAGVYPGRCIQVVELGSHEKTFAARNGKPIETKSVNELLIVWELAELMEDGRPFTVRWMGTNSLNEKANLTKLLVAWRGRAFTEEETKNFDMGTILDKCCFLNVSKTEKGDKIYNNVLSIMPLPKGMACPPAVNELVNFGLGDIDTPEFEKLWPWVAKKVESSKEILALNRPAKEKKEEPAPELPTDAGGFMDDQDIPF